MLLSVALSGLQGYGRAMTPDCPQAAVSPGHPSQSLSPSGLGQQRACSKVLRHQRLRTLYSPTSCLQLCTGQGMMPLGSSIKHILGLTHMVLSIGRLI